MKTVVVNPRLRRNISFSLDGPISKKPTETWKNLNRKYNFIGSYLWMFRFTMVEKWTVKSVRLESLGTSFRIEEQVQSHKAAFWFFTISSDSGLFPHLSVVGGNWPSLTCIGQLPLHFSLLQFSSYKNKWYFSSFFKIRLRTTVLKTT